MGNLALRVDGLSKEYRIGVKQERYKTFRDTLTEMALAPVRRAGNLLRGQAYGAAELNERIWALKDISFDVAHGDVVGIIGRNGAGKSTLLKILSRITEPTEGRVELYGRVGALLEVGTGFHPELTGRENIYLNASILGMSRTEIDRKFDEIVDFAEVEKFIDTPVKHYSSGMALRLGFAVAAHLEPEILVVDEVLAVGDAAFQKKCMGKMSDVAGEGRTVFFVSHNLPSIRHLCKQVIWLDYGQVMMRGETSEIVSKYLEATFKQIKTEDLSSVKRTGSGIIKLLRFYVEDEHGDMVTTLYTGGTYDFVFEFESLANAPLNNVSVAFGVRNQFGDRVTRLSMDDQNAMFHGVEGRGVFRCRVDRLPIAAGEYLLATILNINNEIADYITEVGVITIDAGDFYGGGRISDKGPVFIPHTWAMTNHKSGESNGSAAL